MGGSRYSNQFPSLRTGAPTDQRRHHSDQDFACFGEGFLCEGNPRGARGEHANSTQKGPFDDPTRAVGTEDMRMGTYPQCSQHPRRESNPGPSSCEATALRPLQSQLLLASSGGLVHRTIDKTKSLKKSDPFYCRIGMDRHRLAAKVSVLVGLSSVQYRTDALY